MESVDRVWLYRRWMVVVTVPLASDPGDGCVAKDRVWNVGEWADTGPSAASQRPASDTEGTGDRGLEADG
jgi:hypothetical protein